MKKVMICFILLFSVASVQPLFALESSYDIVPGEDFSVLKEEILSGQGTGIMRIYINYWGTKGIIDYAGSIHYGRVFEEQQEIKIPKSYKTRKEAKEELAQVNPEELRLFPNTLLSQAIQKQWARENYTPLKEYWELAEKDLNYEDIEANFSIIPKPYVPEQFKNVKNLPVKVYVNDQLINFNDSQPYSLGKGKVLVPIRALCSSLGYQIQYQKTADHVSVVTLSNSVRAIDISVWRDYILVNGIAVKVETSPRLSLEERTVVPMEVLYFMAEKVEWDQEKYELKITT